MTKHFAIGLSVLALAGTGLVAALEARPQTDERRVETRTLLGGAGSHLGVTIRNTEADEVESAGLDLPGGVVVETVVDDSPASRSGLRAGDLILAFDQERVRSVDHLRRLVRETPAGRETEVSFLRDGMEQSLVIIPEIDTDSHAIDLSGVRRSIEEGLRSIPGWTWRGPEGLRIPNLPGQRPRLGIVLMPLSEQLRTFFDVSEGVLVSEVDAGSAAEDAGLRAGDVLTHVEGVPVNAPADVVRAAADAGAGATLDISVVTGVRKADASSDAAIRCRPGEIQAAGMSVRCA